MKIAQKAVAIACIGAGLATAVPLAAQSLDARYNELKRRTEDILGLAEAEKKMSPLCQGYIGQVVTFTPFSVLIRNVPDASGKGEFETTAQYEARMAKATSWSARGPHVLPIELRPNYVEYNADIGTMSVRANAFDTGSYSNAGTASASAGASEPRTLKGGAGAFHSVGSVKLVRSYMATTRMGVRFKVSEYDRQTNALYITPDPLFAFAPRGDSWVMMFEVPQARARQVKASLKLALVAELRPPYRFDGTWDYAKASLDSPDVYKERTTVAVVAAKCGLVLDAQNRVLASANAGA